ncbi:MAG: hypothetical protein ABI359_11845 [Ginsengibacter sp.]
MTFCQVHSTYDWDSIYFTQLALDIDRETAGGIGIHPNGFISSKVTPFW